MRGRKPKTTSQQIAEGDPRKHGVHKLAERLETEPKPARGLPPCPPHLKGLAEKAWEFWSAELQAMNLDSRPDAMMLEGACIAYETAIKMHQKITEQGELVAKKERNPTTGQMEVVDVRPHPGLAVRDRALALLRSFCTNSDSRLSAALASRQSTWMRTKRSCGPFCRGRARRRNPRNRWICSSSRLLTRRLCNDVEQHAGGDVAHQSAD